MDTPLVLVVDIAVASKPNLYNASIAFRSVKKDCEEEFGRKRMGGRGGGKYCDIVEGERERETGIGTEKGKKLTFSLSLLFSLPLGDLAERADIARQWKERKGEERDEKEGEDSFFF